MNVSPRNNFRRTIKEEIHAKSVSPETKPIKETIKKKPLQNQMTSSTLQMARSLRMFPQETIFRRNLWKKNKRRDTYKTNKRR